jgi:hypothetical protein
MVQNRRKPQRPRARKPNPSLRVYDFTNLNRRRIFRFAVESNASISGVDLFQIGKKFMGSTTNPVANALLGTTGVSVWSIEQSRLLRIRVCFDLRAATPIGITGALPVNSRSRVGAFLTTLTTAEIDNSKITGNIGAFTPHTFSPNGKRTIMLKVGPEFKAGQFTDEIGATLVVVSTGYYGFVRIVWDLEVLGFPATQIQLAKAPEVSSEGNSIIQRAKRDLHGPETSSTECQCDTPVDQTTSHGFNTLSARRALKRVENCPTHGGSHDESDYEDEDTIEVTQTLDSLTIG